MAARQRDRPRPSPRYSGRTPRYCGSNLAVPRLSGMISMGPIAPTIFLSRWQVSTGPIPSCSRMRGVEEGEALGGQLLREHAERRAGGPGDLVQRDGTGRGGRGGGMMAGGEQVVDSMTWSSSTITGSVTSGAGSSAERVG